MASVQSAAVGSSGGVSVASGAERGVREQVLPVTAPDGYPLEATLFEPLQPGPGGGRVVVVNSATAVPRGFYQHFARALAGRGFRVVTYDYRGIGGSRYGKLRGFEATMEQWGSQDFEGVLRYVRNGLGAERALVVGHSVGGQVVGLAPSAGMIAAVAGFGAQVGQLAFYEPGERAKMMLFWHGILPAATAVMGYLPGWAGVGEDLPRGVALEWRRWFLTPGYFFAVEGGAARRAAFARLGVPVLAMSVEGDFYAPRRSVDAWAALFDAGEVRRVHVDDRAVGHFGFFRRQHAAQWARVWEFLESVPGVS